MSERERSVPDQEQDRERSRAGSAAAAAGGLAAGGLAQREAIGNLFEGEAGEAVEASPASGIPDASLDVFDDMQPPERAPGSDSDEFGPGMPLLRFDAPDVPAAPEDVASIADPLDEAPAPTEAAALEVPSSIFDVTLFSLSGEDPSRDLDDVDEGDDVDTPL
jgi:hypothetical protein